MLLDVSINQAFNMGGPQLLAFILLTSILVSYGKKLDMEHDGMRTAEHLEDGTAPLTAFVGDMPVITTKDRTGTAVESLMMRYRMVPMIRCRRRCRGRTLCVRHCVRYYSSGKANWQG